MVYIAGNEESANAYIDKISITNTDNTLTVPWPCNKTFVDNELALAKSLTKICMQNVSTQKSSTVPDKEVFGRYALLFLIKMQYLIGNNWNRLADIKDKCP